ncbi:acetyl-CoA synthetase-like protein [Backusella circina FSU 941]|nr:acetyl-CoA synthetase-like protein [Backusella circina FSU 941]
MTPLTIERAVPKGTFRHLGECLQSRSTHTADAFILGNTSISYKTLNEKATGIAHQLTGKRVGLIYRTSQILQFIPALLGCFLAGIPAIPIHQQDHAEILFILNITDVDLILTTSDNVLTDLPPHITVLNTDMMDQKKNEGLFDVVPELAYIEFTKANNGELKGVTVSHTSVMEQCAGIQASLGDGYEVILSHYDPRLQVGLILSVFYPIYAGHTVVFIEEEEEEEMPALWIRLLFKFKVTMALSDYPTMTSVTRYFEQLPQDVLPQYSNALSNLRHLLIDTTTVQSRLNAYINETLIEPLGSKGHVVRPILSLPEYGGRIISIHDDTFACLLETRALGFNKVKVEVEQGTFMESFSFCMPNATVAIVDPNTTALCPPDTLGEVWIDTHSTDGFWGLPQHTELIFHARPIMADHHRLYPGAFLRTGLCGTMIGGRLFIMGSYEERIRQRLDGSLEEQVFFSGAILETINRRVQIHQCTVFEILIKDQHLPVIICESAEAQLDLKVRQINDALLDEHGLRPFCIAFVKPNTLPRLRVHGHAQIHTLLVKRHFLQGRIFTQHLKMNVSSMGMKEEPICKNIWQSKMIQERAAGVQQHTSMETIKVVLDERTNTNMSRFTHLLEILQWRASMYPEETAFVLHPKKAWSWKKTSTKVAMMAHYLTKRGMQRGAKVVVSVPFGLDYLLAIYGTLAAGAIPIPIEPIPDQVQLLVDVCHDLSVSHILVDGDDPFKTALKQKRTAKLPEMINVTSTITRFGKEDRFYLPAQGSTAVIQIHNSPAGHRYYAYTGHDTLINQCSTLKTTCQMRWQRGIVASGLGSYEGLGFLYAIFCGVYVGCVTVYLPTQAYYTNPTLLFECFQRYKVKDACVTSTLLQYAMNRMHTKDTLILHGLQNMMLATDGRPKPLFYHHIVSYLARHRLQQHTINTTYVHVGNPIVTTRSYMQMDPITLSLDPYWLKHGIIHPLPPNEERYGVLLHDSGMVPSNTAIAIVNPETHALSSPYTMGEVWVMSDNNAQTLSSKDNPVDRCEATIVGMASSAQYMRTGDYGFLWSIQRATSSSMERGQCLFLLGPMNETLCHDGLVHFPFDIEVSIERCHPTIPSGGSVVFQTETGEMVAVVAVKVSDYAISIVPALVSAIFERHQLLMDTFVVVHPRVLTRSRQGEKRRRSIMQAYLASTLDAIYIQKLTDSDRETLQADSPL